MLAVKVDAVAKPLELVVAVVVVEELVKVPDAPEDGAVKLTVTPGTPVPCESVTNATSGEPKALWTVADCPEPEAAEMVAGLPMIVQQYCKGRLWFPAPSVATALKQW